ncbi:hypothetical protein [Paludibaculum fermentans]|uniref:Carboxypeptidase regulatory-like domain-containing protein n=1 Tax=Paludibaculum fermentans TaxID=1473598 RepID=A0A7S7SNZ8_PALFE|nr:hypothetical protein [Paludibaculum fermentans]QOY91463.1 hypothetical protein IRI77_16390 [Paludibaculum fermentans]
MNRSSLLWLILGAFLLSSPSLRGSQEQREYCAFEVIVRSSTGNPAAATSVSLFDDSGKPLMSALTNEQGLARICDAPSGLVRLTVGGVLCGTVSVGQLKRYWMQTRRINITYDNCSGDGWVPLGGCMLTIRVKAKDGSALIGAKFLDPHEGLKSREQTIVSDSRGRIFRFMEFGETMTGSVESDGYESQSVTNVCKRGDPRDSDLIVVLAPIRPQ